MSTKTQISVIIIDDSLQSRKLLRLMLLEYIQGIDIIGEAENAEEGLDLIEKLQPDAIFLDIEMPGKTGLQLVEILLEKNYKGKVVFTTAYNTYAIKAFRLSAIDYLLKPIQEEHLIQAVEKLIEEKKNRENRLKLLADNLYESKSEVLCVPMQGGNEFLELDKIICIEASGSYVRIVCVSGRDRILSKNLKYFETVLLDEKQFVRTHRSFIINLNFLVFHSKSEGNLLLKNGVKIPISRERKQLVMSSLNNFKKG